MPSPSSPHKKPRNEWMSLVRSQSPNQHMLGTIWKAMPLHKRHQERNEWGSVQKFPIKISAQYHVETEVLCPQSTSSSYRRVVAPWIRASWISTIYAFPGFSHRNRTSRARCCLMFNGGGAHLGFLWYQGRRFCDLRCSRGSRGVQKRNIWNWHLMV